MTRIALDAKLLGRSLIFMLLLCWPLMLFGRPGYFADTLAYYTGGDKAVGSVFHRLSPADPTPSSAPVSKVTPPPTDTHDVKSARSIPYSVLAFGLRGADRAMTPLAVMQAMMVAFIVSVFLAVINVTGVRWWATILWLALATPAAWVASFAMPDVFAGLTILIIAIMVFRADRLTAPVTVGLCGIGALAISSHASHVAIAILLLPLGLIWRAIQRPASGQPHVRSVSWLWMAAPIVLGILAVVVSGFIGFGEVSVAPKRLPLVLARSIGDGPARWYLDRHCPSGHYVVCEIYGRDIPKTSNDFLWGPSGVATLATPSQMQRLRNEEQDIVYRATMAYPLQQLRASLTGLTRQLIHFRIVEENFNIGIAPGKTAAPVFRADSRMSTDLRDMADTLSEISAALALVWLAVGFPAASPERRALALFLVAGIVANAAVCAILSGASDRYQARVIWLAPLAAVVIPTPFRRRTPRSPRPAAAQEDSA